MVLMDELDELRERFPGWRITTLDEQLCCATRGVVAVVAWSPAQLAASMREAEDVTLSWDDVVPIGRRYGSSLPWPDCPATP